MTPPTAEERAAWRQRHIPDKHYQGRYCLHCVEHWPCPVVRTLDALEAAEAGRDVMTQARDTVVEDVIRLAAERDAALAELARLRQRIRGQETTR